MKHILINLVGELPYLLVFTACYILIDRLGFNNRLSELIREGWRKRLSKVGGRIRRGGKLLPLQPADNSKVLDTVAFDVGLSGHTGEATPDEQNNKGDNDSFTDEEKADTVSSGGKNPVVGPDEQDDVFKDDRIIIPGDKEDVVWDDGEAPPPEELTTEETYSDDGYNEYEDYADHYNELDTALGIVVGKPMSEAESLVARRAIMNLQGTPEYSELEARSEEIKRKINAVVAQIFDTEVPTDPRHADGFSIGEYM